MQPLSKSLKQIVPYLSAYDQPDVPEGALDPLGLYSISDAITVNYLCPGIRERQKHPGFLVTLAIGASVTESFTESYLNEKTLTPMQVFEWYVVHALVRTYGKSKPQRLAGLPGKDKVATALAQSESVAEGNYLKTPSVFGFYGVYKLLARDLEILSNDNMGPECARLNKAWEHDVENDIGDTRSYYNLVREAVAYGLNNHKTQKNWKHWETFARPLVTNDPGKRSSAVIWELLTDPNVKLRSEYFQFIVKQGAKVISADSETNEKALHTELLKSASPEMVEIIKTIQLYEEFSWLITDAFYHILYVASKSEKKVSPGELTTLSSVKTAVKRLPVIRDKLQDGLAQYNLDFRFNAFLNLFNATGNKEEWVNALLDHHVKNQQNKPPNGKMPFFDYFDDGSIRTRLAYQQTSAPTETGEYVHHYRLASLWSFAKDLGKV